MSRPWLRGKPLPEEFKFTDYVTTRNEYGRKEDSFKTQDIMIGALIGILLTVILLGLLWWAIMQLWPLIARYLAEPFRTIAWVIIVVIMVLIAIYIIIQLLGMAGVSVPWYGSHGLR